MTKASVVLEDYTWKREEYRKPEVVTTWNYNVSVTVSFRRLSNTYRNSAKNSLLNLHPYVFALKRMVIAIMIVVWINIPIKDDHDGFLVSA